MPSLVDAASTFLDGRLKGKQIMVASKGGPGGSSFEAAGKHQMMGREQLVSCKVPTKFFTFFCPIIAKIAIAAINEMGVLFYAASAPSMHRHLAKNFREERRSNESHTRDVVGLLALS